MVAVNPDKQRTYQINPIILTGGIASQIPGGMLLMTSIMRSINPDLSLDDAFGAFNVLPGGTLVHQQIAKYPFANQWVAANATIREPLTVSVIMDAPMRGPRAWDVKKIVMTALKAVLDRHNNLGGTYTVETPAYMYDNMIMTSLTDNSRGNNSLPQNAWRFEFERPLVALADLVGAQNQLMSKITNGLVTNGQQSGIQVGSDVAQTQLVRDYTTSVGGLLTSQNPTLMDNLRGLQSVPINFPATPSTSQFIYAGIS